MERKRQIKDSAKVEVEKINDRKDTEVETNE